MATLFTPGRTIIILGNLAYGLGAFQADWNETHGKLLSSSYTNPSTKHLLIHPTVFNPNWPPHAKFHNGQSLSLAVCTAVASTYFALRPVLTNSTISAKESIFDAAAIGSFYCFSGLTSILYPGADWSDPEYPHGGGQKYIFSFTVAAMWAGYFLEASRLGKGKVA